MRIVKKRDGYDVEYTIFNSGGHRLDLRIDVYKPKPLEIGSINFPAMTDIPPGFIPNYIKAIEAAEALAYGRMEIKGEQHD